MDSTFYETVEGMTYGERPHEALLVLRAVAEPLDPLRHKEALAEAYLLLRQYHEAVHCARSAIDGGRDTPKLRYVLALALWELGFFAVAKEQLSLFPEAPEILATGAQFAMAEKDYGEAERLARQALESSPDMLWATINLLSARSARGSDRAWNDLVALWTEEHRHDAVHPIIREATRRGALKEVQAIVESALSEATEDPGFYESILLSYLITGEYAEGLTMLERVPAPMRRNWVLLCAEGRLLVMSGKVKEAIPVLQAAAKAEPADLMVNHWLIKATFKAGRLDRIPGLIFGYAGAVRRMRVGGLRS